MELDVVAVFLSYCSASCCDWLIHSLSLHSAQTASPVQWFPAKSAEHPSHCLGWYGAMVVLQYRRDLFCCPVWSCVHITSGSSQTERSCSFYCKCPLYTLMVWQQENIEWIS